MFIIDVLKKLFGKEVLSGAEGKQIRQKCNQKGKVNNEPKT